MIYSNLWTTPIILIAFITLGYHLDDWFLSLLAPVVFTVVTFYSCIRYYKAAGIMAKGFYLSLWIAPVIILFAVIVGYFMNNICFRLFLSTFIVVMSFHCCIKTLNKKA